MCIPQLSSNSLQGIVNSFGCAMEKLSHLFVRMTAEVQS